MTPRAGQVAIRADGSSRKPGDPGYDDGTRRAEVLETAASLIATLLRLPARFVVTPKGLSSTSDHILTFRRHLQWALVLVVAIVTSIVMGYAAPAVLLWPVVALCACLAPPALWIVERVVADRGELTFYVRRDRLPDVALDAALADHIAAYLKQGGTLLLTGMSGLKPDGQGFALDLCGVEDHGPSRYAPEYVRWLDHGEVGATPDTALDPGLSEAGRAGRWHCDVSHRRFFASVGRSRRRRRSGLAPRARCARRSTRSPARAPPRPRRDR